MYRQAANQVLLLIESRLDDKGIRDTKKAVLDLSKLTPRALFSDIGDKLTRGLRNAAGEAFRLLNPLNLIPKTLGLITGGFSLLGRVATTALGVAVGTAVSTITRSLAQLAQSPVEVAARVEVLENGLRVMAATAGQSIEFVEGKVADLKKTGITTREAIESITQFLSNKLPISNIEELARAAQNMAVVFGKNSSETFSRFVEVILTGNTELLKSVAIAKTAQQMYDEYGTTIGKTGSALDEAEKRQARLNAIMQAAAPYAGQYENAMDNVGKKIQSLPRYIEEAQLAIGRGFTPILNASVDILTEVLKGVTGFFEKHRSVFEGFGDAVGEGLRTGWERAKGWLAEITGALLPDFDPQAWFQGGVDLVVSLADGLLTGLSDYVIPAVIQIADVIASFLLGASPPKRGPLRRVIQGAIALMETYMRGFGEADYSILDKVLGPIEQRLQAGVTLGEIGEGEVFGRIAEARAQVAAIVAEFSQTGAIPTEKLAELAQLIGTAGDQYARLLQLHLQFKAASEKVAELEEKVAQAQEAGFVPEALKAQLAAAEKERDEASKRVQLAEIELRQRQKNLDLMAGYERLMERLSNRVREMVGAQLGVARATKDSADITDKLAETTGQLGQAIDQLPAKIDEARQKWKETFLEMFSSFSKLETPLGKLSDFVKGFLGFYGPEQREFMGRFGMDVSEAYKQGEKARETFNLLVEGIKTLPGKVSEFVQELGRLKSEWWDPLDPALKKVLLGTIALNFVTGGAVGDVLRGLIVGAFAAAGLTVALEAGALAAALYITIKPFLSEEVREDWKKALHDLTTLEHDPLASIGKAAETTLEHTPIMSELLNWVDSLFAKKPEIEETARQTLRDPLITAGQEAHEALVGHSIIPEMVEGVMRWLTQLEMQAVALLTRLKIRAITLFTQLKTQVIQIVVEMARKVTEAITEMVDAVLEELARLKEEGGVTLEEIAVIFEDMGSRMVSAIDDIVDEINRLISKLDDLIRKAKEAKDAWEDLPFAPGSPPPLAVGLQAVIKEMYNLDRVMASLARMPTGLEMQRVFNVAPAVVPVPAAAVARGGTTINNYLVCERVEFPSVRSARDAGDFWREVQAKVELGTAKASVPGGAR